MKLVFSALADQQLIEIVEYYNRIDIKLKKRFLKELKFALKSISENPYIYSKRYKNYRRVNLKKFPYGVFYKISEDHIMINVVLHAKRNFYNLLK
jgi:plasmid stabilization system protein ParE